jgi:hypothetical protein
MTSKSNQKIDDNYLQWDRLVIVCAQHGEKFMGWVPPEVEDPRKHMLECTDKGLVCELRDVRILASQLQAIPDRSGGISNLMVLMPVDMFPRGMQKHYIKVSTFYFPSDNEDCKHQVKALIENAIQMEARRELLKIKKSAEDAGLIVPDPNLSTGGGH